MIAESTLSVPPFQPNYRALEGKGLGVRCWSCASIGYHCIGKYRNTEHSCRSTDRTIDAE